MGFGISVLIWAAAAALSGDEKACNDETLRQARLEACTRLIAAHPMRDEGLAKLLDRRAATHAAQDQHAPAAEDLGAAMRLRRPDAEVLGRIGVQYFHAGEYETALRHFNQAVVLAPQSADVLFWRARAYRKLEQPHNAEIDFNAAIALRPGHAQSYLQRGMLYDQLKLQGKALADYDKALALDPAALNARYRRAWLLIERRSFAEAHREADACMQAAPDEAACQEIKAEAFRAQGNTDSAIETFSRAIARTPDRPNYYVARATLLRQRGDYDAAIADLDSAATHGKDEAEMLYDRAWLHAAAGRPDNAIADYSRLLRETGVEAWPNALLERAMARLVRGDIAAARKDLDDVAPHLPENGQAALLRAAVAGRLERERFLGWMRPNPAAAALIAAQNRLELSGADRPFVDVLTGKRSVAQAHQEALAALKRDQSNENASCFTDAIAGQIALAQGDEAAARGYFEAAERRQAPLAFPCMIAVAELNRMRVR
jgi:tetratricopeptide (TPR) repeat protein